MDGGYDLSRFIQQIRQEMLCCICLNVLNVPRLCKEGMHYFCFNCISRHLQNSETCPVCRESLTMETLQTPQKFFKTILSELIIRCNYNNRGCQDHVQLGNLQDHVKICEYRPVPCKSCGVQVNTRDLDDHQSSCQRFVLDMLDLQRQELNELKNCYEDIHALTNSFQNEMKNEVMELKRKHDYAYRKVKRMKVIKEKLLATNIVSFYNF